MPTTKELEAKILRREGLIDEVLADLHLLADALPSDVSEIRKSLKSIIERAEKKRFT
jgi:DNA-binding winged helix-turn-helix (wHTH) protein